VTSNRLIAETATVSFQHWSRQIMFRAWAAYGAGILFAQWRAGPLQDRPDTVALCCEVENL
jgi:hypothetical protein